MLSRVDTRTERGSLPNHGVWALDKQVERPGFPSQYPEAREMSGAKHILLGTEDRLKALTIT